MKPKKKTNKNPFKTSKFMKRFEDVYVEDEDDSSSYSIYKWIFEKVLYRYSLKQFIQKKQAVDIQVHNYTIVLLSKKDGELYVSAHLHLPEWYSSEKISRKNILNCMEPNPPQLFWEVQEYKGGNYTAMLRRFFYPIKNYPLCELMHKKKAVDVQVDNNMIHLLSKDENGNLYVSAKVYVYERDWCYLNRNNVLDYTGKAKGATGFWHINEYKGEFYDATLCGDIDT